MIYAKPSTALLVVFRAYLASDHVTPATGKTIAITISKNGGAFGNPNAGATNATEISSGFYKVTLDTTDTGTAGPLAVRGAEAAIDDVGAIFYVGQSPADVTHIGGSAVTASGGIPAVNVTQISGQTATATTPVTVPAAIASTTNITAATGIDVTKFGGSNITSAAGIPEVKVASIANDAVTAAAIAANAIGASELAADAVTEIQSGLATSSALSTLQTSVDDIPTNADLATALAAADDAVLAAIAALNNLSAAQVNAEVVDALNVDTYAEPGQEAPGATVSLVKKIGYLYKFLRNKITQTATTLSIFADDASTVDQKATVSDDATTYTRGEIGSGP